MALFPNLSPLLFMNVVDLASGESHDFTLEESNGSILKSLKDLSLRGGNLRFTMTHAEKEKLEEKFDHGFHVALRDFVGADDSLTYREEEGGENYVFTTYFKPD